MRKLHKNRRDLGLWQKGCVPKEPQYKVLAHLAAPGNPRLYVQKVDTRMYPRASLSNTEHVAGWPVNCDLRPLFGGRVYDSQNRAWECNPWIEPDKEETKKCPPSTRVYKITEAGLEALAQYLARKEYDSEFHQRAVLNKYRKMVSAREE